MNYAEIKVSTEQTNYVVKESTGWSFQGLLICATVEVGLPFNLSAVVQNDTAQCMSYSIKDVCVFVHVYVCMHMHVHVCEAEG